MISKEENVRRLGIYYRGGTIAKMAEQAGITASAYQEWMSKRGLPHHLKRTRVKKPKINYAYTRPETERRIIKHFMVCLLETDKRRQKLTDTRRDVLSFINEYRDIYGIV